MIRISNTCRRLGYIPCGIYSDADKNSLHVKYCEDAKNIGGNLPSESYLNMVKIIDAAKKMECTAIHPGYGFLSEKSEFAKLCENEGLVFIGPSSNTLKTSGDKMLAKQVISAIATVVEGKELSDIDEAMSFAEKLGYPVIIKATKGGGGRGLRIINTPDELNASLFASKQEAKISFGSDRVYIEKYLQNPRHIEVQIIGDKSNIIHLGERECTVQRRYQKLIEETPSPALTDELRQRLTETAVGIMKKIGYENAGTVEFLFKEGKFYFMEINSRIQVEHPITEAVTGIDIVEQQLNIAFGQGLSLQQSDVKSEGHAIECRINAEHPITFAPYPGVVKSYLPPHIQSIRIDSSLYSGYQIPSFYDSLLAKVISKGKDRNDAISKMIGALTSFRIRGVPSTIPFHLSALNDFRFLQGNYDTSFIDNLKPYSDKDGEIAAIVFYGLSKKNFFRKKRRINKIAMGEKTDKRDKKEIEKEKTTRQFDPWILSSRYNWYFKPDGDYGIYNLTRWIR